MRVGDPIDTGPIATYVVCATWTLVTLAGAIVALFGDGLSAAEYLTALGLVAIGTGLLGIGRGIAEYGRQRAGADALKLAHELREEYHERPYDPDV